MRFHPTFTNPDNEVVVVVTIPLKSVKTSSLLFVIWRVNLGAFKESLKWNELTILLNRE